MAGRWYPDSLRCKARTTVLHHRGDGAASSATAYEKRNSLFHLRAIIRSRSVMMMDENQSPSPRVAVEDYKASLFMGFPLTLEPKIPQEALRGPRWPEGVISGHIGTAHKARWPRTHPAVRSSISVPSPGTEHAKPSGHDLEATIGDARPIVMFLYSIFSFSLREM